MWLALRPETRAEARNATDGATAPRGGRLGSSCDCGAGLSWAVLVVDAMRAVDHVALSGKPTVASCRLACSRPFADAVACVSSGFRISSAPGGAPQVVTRT